ncbi:ATP synthase subunit a [Bienertia sinuspersici]
MELALVTRRKLGFVIGVVERDTDNKKKQDFAIKKSIIYYTSARELWVHLEKRFTVSNGVLKYKINRQLYDTQQNGQPINEYYTKLYSLWEELDDLNELPPVTQYTTEIRAFLNTVRKLTEEQHLFQFLMGLDDEYGAQRSQLWLRSSLPSVETACSQLQQEESQREVNRNSELTSEMSAMMSKGKEVIHDGGRTGLKNRSVENVGEKSRRLYDEECAHYGRRNHTS